jgi:hypothetical protein
VSQDNDVVRINTNLVQTDVMVFDKQARFVDSLRREQFELTIDGKSQPIAFFGQVRAGSLEEARLASRGNNGRAQAVETKCIRTDQDYRRVTQGLEISAR